MSAIGNKEVFAKNLKHYIDMWEREYGKGRVELSKEWGFPYSTITGWLQATKYPRIDRIQIMAEYFGIPMSELIEEQQKQPDENDGLSSSQRDLIAFAKTLSEDQAAMFLRMMKSALEAD